MFDLKKTSRMFRVALAVLVCLLALVLVACGGKDTKKEVTVTFYVDGVVYHTITNSEITLPQDPTKDGYTFAGWYLDDGVFTQAFSGSTEIDVSVYAKWTQNTPAHEHNWGAWETTTQPTCTQKGVETRICLGCGESETREVAALEHNWSEWGETTAPTCTEKGVETRTCSRCNKTETREVAAFERMKGKQ